MDHDITRSIASGSADTSCSQTSWESQQNLDIDTVPLVFTCVHVLFQLILFCPTNPFVSFKGCGRLRDQERLTLYANNLYRFPLGSHIRTWFSVELYSSRGSQMFSYSTEVITRNLRKSWRCPRVTLVVNEFSNQAWQYTAIFMFIPKHTQTYNTSSSTQVKSRPMSRPSAMCQDVPRPAATPSPAASEPKLTAPWPCRTLRDQKKCKSRCH